MKKIIAFIKSNPLTIESVYRKIGIFLLIYSGFRFLTDRKLIYYDFVMNIIYSRITEALFWIAVVSWIGFAIAKYLILKKPLF